ncbi:WhiB family transcriptional regulator [Saccharopolyspora taberi]|uniref:Transcriptional regulator WhiB n=1 Tax=Saccharopolyspora taberi TaxID=60895 RepID=A0ABN3V0H4_9PSEU
MLTQDWRADAACQDMDPELFAPASYEGPGAVQAEAAKAVCAGCPVVDECLQGAIAQEDDTTVRGGMTPEERRALRRSQSIPRLTLAVA